MRHALRLLILLLTISTATAHAQAAPNASQLLRFSVFAGGTLDYTSLSSGRNGSITAGADLGIRPFFHIQPSAELRGQYPFIQGQVDAQRNILGGIQLARRYNHLRPYIDILYGHGSIDYLRGGYLGPTGTILYSSSTGPVLSPGAGVDIDLIRHFALKLDLQLQRYQTPVTPSGYLYSKPITAALVYHLGF